ncbi:GntR family transcriptional regulator YhfZ [Enterococcus sp. DIV0086]|uniref:GntR family transcriptional regulator YhfZ n=1 Tax=Enterococcus sp. DIV0086 TaxID=2774655 RepID=UPI003D299DB1
MQEKFLNKTGKAIQQLSCDLFLLSEGSRLPVISDLQEKYGLSRGTVQNAFRYLKDENIIHTLSQGRHGTILTTIDYGKLQKIILEGTIRGTMPLPYSKLYEGFATGLYEVFHRAEIPLSMAYIRGSKERIELTSEKTIHFSIVSKLAAIKAIEAGGNLEISKEFGSKSFLSSHVMIFSNSKSSQIEDGMRVGIDHTSYDQQILTENATNGKKVTFIEIPSHQLIYSLEQEVIDVGIWNYDEIKDRKLDHLNYQFLEGSKEDSLSSTAVCVLNKDNLLLKKILMSVIDVATILSIQEDVLEGKIIPHY